MANIIQIVGLAVGGDSPLDGQYVHDFDPDGYAGRGNLRATDDPARAKRFENAIAAWEFWRAQSTVKPMRDDGRPNRPLTAYTVKVLPINS